MSGTPWLLKAIGRAVANQRAAASSSGLAAGSAEGGRAEQSALVPVGEQALALCAEGGLEVAMRQAASLPLEESKALVRRACKAVSTSCGEHGRAEVAELNEWSRGQETSTAPGLGNALGQVVPIPKPMQDARPLRFEWQPPVIETAKHILKKVDEESTSQMHTDANKLRSCEPFRAELRKF